MSQHHETEHSDAAIAVAGVQIPRLTPPAPADIARRKALAAEAERIREAIGPLGFSAVDLIREARDELDTYSR